MSVGITELFANTYATTLSAAITSTGATTCSVTSTTGAPSTTTGNWRILVDTEIMIVTAVSGTTLTITRGAEGTTAATHLISAPVTHVLTRDAIKVGLQQTRPRVTNTANATYTIDSTDSVNNVAIWHNKSGHVSYVLPAPSDGRHLELRDQTGAIQTATNWVSIVPAAGEKINASTGFAMSGTAYHFTNGSTAVTATSSKFTSELYVGCSIASSNQAGVNYIVSAIGSDLSLTLATNFTGTTTTTATATRTSLLFAANGSVLEIDSDGTDWLITGDGTPTTITYTAAGTFIPPAGVYTLDSIGGWGGGGGGTGGGGGASGTTLGSALGGAGGGGAEENTVFTVAVTPNTGYAVAIGAGGTGGAGGPGASAGTTSQNGAASTVGSLCQFLGGSGGGPSRTSVTAETGIFSMGGAPWSASASSAVGTANVYASSALSPTDSVLVLAGLNCPSTTSALSSGAGGSGYPGNGGDGGRGVTTNVTAGSGSAGNPWTGRGNAAGGTGGGGGGTASSTNAGGTGGGGGGGGPGGQGGGGGGGGGGTATAVHGTNGAAGTGANNGVAGTTGASSVGGAGGNGGAGAANSGAGGGGGGAGGSGNTTGGAGGTGGNGGSGQITITYRL